MRITVMAGLGALTLACCGLTHASETFTNPPWLVTATVSSPSTQLYTLPGESQGCATVTRGQHLLAEELPFETDGERFLSVFGQLGKQGLPLPLPASCPSAFIRLSDCTTTPIARPTVAKGAPGHAFEHGSKALQRQLAAAGGPRVVTLKNADAAVPLYLSPGGESLRPPVSAQSFYEQHLFVAVQEHQQWLKLLDMRARCPAVWIRASEVDEVPSDDGRGHGYQVIIDLGANPEQLWTQWGAAAITRRSGPLEDGGELQPGWTLLEFDGLKICFRDALNLDLSMTRPGASLGGITLSDPDCNQAWLEKAFGAVIKERGTNQQGEGVWTLTGGPDGWNYTMFLTFAGDGLVKKMDFHCAEADLTH